MKFIIFRHGQTDWNVSNIMQGQVNIDLNENGVSQAKELATKLKEYNLQTIISSDLSRALKTARMVGDFCQVDITSDARLREKSFGKAEGLSVSQVIERYGLEEWEKFRDYSPEGLDFSFPAGESRRECLARTLAVLKDAHARYDGMGPIGISTHGGVIRSLLANAGIIAVDKMKVKNCAFFHLESDGARFVFPEIKGGGVLD